MKKKSKLLKEFFIFLYNKVILIIYPIGKIIDFLFMPISFLESLRGKIVIEIKTRSFGHHLNEAAAIALHYKNKKNKKIILLSKKNKALVPEANDLVSQVGKVFDSYNIFSYYYWLSRSPLCGPVRNFRNLNKYEFFYKENSIYRDEPCPFNIECFADEEVKDILNKINPKKKPIAWWKPKITSNKIFSRSSSIDAISDLLKILDKDGYIVLAYCQKDISHLIPKERNIYSISNPKTKHKLSMYLDGKCDFAICGQSGGSMLCQLFRKPLIIYDIAFPYILYYFSPKTLIHLKKVFNKEKGRYMKLNELMEFTSHAEMYEKGLIFEGINSINLVKLYLEMKKKKMLYAESFPINSYELNKNNFYKNIFLDNIYNRWGPPQISDTSFRELLKYEII